MKEDKFIFGSFSGMIGGLIALVIWSLPAKMLGLTDRIFYDYGMYLLLYKPKQEFLDFVVGLLAHLGIAGLHGIIFAALIAVTSSRYLITKGLLYGCIVWLLNLGAGTVFRIPMFTTIPASAALVTWVGSVLWGVVTSVSLGIFENRAVSNDYKETRENGLIPAPAMKKLGGRKDQS